MPPPPPNSLPPSLLERYFAQHEFSTPLLACCSDVEPLTVSELLEIASGGNGNEDGRAAPGEETTTTSSDDDDFFFRGVSLGYRDPRGSPELREAVAREHGGGVAVTSDDVLVAAPQELAYLLQRAVLQEGDTIVAQWPGYPGLTAVAEAVGATVVPWFPRWEEEEEGGKGGGKEGGGKGGGGGGLDAPAPPPAAAALAPRFDVEEDLVAALDRAAALVRDPKRTTTTTTTATTATTTTTTAPTTGKRPAALRLAVLNFPQNPTGCSLRSASELRRALELCVEKGTCHVLSDEMYRGLQLKEEEEEEGGQLPTAAGLVSSLSSMSSSASSFEPFANIENRKKIISLGGLSKWGGAPGLRIGWLVTGDRELLGRMSSLRDHTTICNSSLSESLAARVLAQPATAERLRARARGIVKQNLRVVAEDFFQRRNRDFFEFYSPRASTTCLPRLREESVGMGVEEFARRAREEAGVLLLPASTFGGIESASSSSSPSPSVPRWMEGRFRLGLGRKDLPEALAALDALTEKMRREQRKG